MKKSNDHQHAQNQQAEGAVQRRDFLKLAGTAAPAAVVLAATAPQVAEAAPEAKKSGLQDNAHTRTYYQLARF